MHDAAFNAAVSVKVTCYAMMKNPLLWVSQTG